ncbi:unnamed protein product [Paramecium octaurelia]|uniref:Uncharacterized protein n=1 Tax=Paramecium octaurelia TaxID=43137 RepID=A0A8S1XS24_PAROT|nr:unnamed protein product [Paramecium octaurelia]
MDEFLDKEYYLGGHFVEIEVLSTTLVDELFQGKFLFFARNGAHYGINFNFTCQDLRCELKDQEVFAVIQGYHDFALFESHTVSNIPTISLQNDLLLIVYCYWANDDKILAAYRLPKNNQKHVPILFFGALEFSNDYLRKEKQLISYQLNNKEYVLLNSYDFSTLTRYEVNPSPKIVYNGTMKSEVLNISVENQDNSQVLSLNIEVESEDPEEDSHILLYAAGGAGGVLGIGIIVYCCKKKKIADTLL